MTVFFKKIVKKIVKKINYKFVEIPLIMYVVLCMKKGYLGDGETGLICNNPFIGVFSNIELVENAIACHINFMHENVLVSDYTVINTEINECVVDKEMRRVEIEDEDKEIVYDSSLY